MDNTTAVTKIKIQITALQLLNLSDLDESFDLWNRETRTLLIRLFGKESEQVKDFQTVQFTPWVMPVIAFAAGPRSKPIKDRSPTEQEKIKAFQEGKKKMGIILTALFREIEEHGLSNNVSLLSNTNASIEMVKRICSRFHRMKRPLQNRHGNRSPFPIQDEYDVQDLLHALLLIHFEDVRPEETTPSYAGGAARTDFLLKSEKIIVEVKKTRKGLLARTVGEELLIDISRYKAHPDCNMLVCFIYDPEQYIDNPQGLISDLSKNHDGVEVIVIISPS